MAYFEELEVGQAAEATRTVTARDIEAFGHAVGDLNPVHFDEAYAATTPFKGRIAHGVLLAGYISAVLGTELPGPGAIYMTQSLLFKRAVHIGDELRVRVEVKAIDEKTATVTLATDCFVGRKNMLTGEATVTVSRRVEAA